MGVAIADASEAEWFEVGGDRERWLHGNVCGEKSIHYSIVLKKNGSI